MKLTEAVRSFRLKEYLRVQAAVRAHARTEQAERHRRREERAAIGGSADGLDKALGLGCFMIVAFVAGLGILIFLIKFFWEMF